MVYILETVQAGPPNRPVASIFGEIPSMKMSGAITYVGVSLTTPTARTLVREQNFTPLSGH
jgi:hypothetical protein